VFPIVQSGASQVVVVDPEAERSDQPQFGLDRDTRPPNIARIVGDLGLMQNNV
jgi:hypothetical protein